MTEDAPEVEGLLSASQVAERIGVPHRQVSRLVNTGAIPILGHFGVQKQLVFREDDIEQYIEAHHTS